jgi:hypothetical protein
VEALSETMAVACPKISRAAKKNKAIIMKRIVPPSSIVSQNGLVKSAVFC